MATHPDARPRLSESLACGIGCLTPQKRRAWVKRGVLPDWDAKGGFTELQVIQITVVRVLHDALGPHGAKVAWSEIEKDLLQGILQPRLDLVIDVDRLRCHLVRSDQELALAVRTTVCLRVIPLAEEIAEARLAFQRHWRALPSGGRASRRGESASESA
jgi:hypothetical protein